VKVELITGYFRKDLECYENYHATNTGD